GEVNGCDLVGVREGAPPILVVCEMKLSFNLELVLQGVNRAAISDEVWLAARASKRQGREHDARVRNLSRRGARGMIDVSASGVVDVILEPFAATPRRDPKRRSRLLDEHRRRVGDPQAGGGRGKPIMTAYRQDCILCATFLLSGPQSPRELKTRVARAPT